MRFTVLLSSLVLLAEVSIGGPVSRSQESSGTALVTPSG